MATIVAFHAHPDDEALLTGGTLAKAAGLGHRVVLVVATDGERGLAARSVSAGGLERVRTRELDAAARALGVARVVRLGLPDSGWGSTAAVPERAFSRLPVAEAADGLVDVLRQEGAQVLTTYDAAGGYGHPDHVAVHHAGAFAAAQAGTPAVLQATAPRETVSRVVRLASWVPGLLDVHDRQLLLRGFSPRAAITVEVDVRPFLDAKLAALAAHASQATSDAGPRTLRLLAALPPAARRLVLGREWFAGSAAAAALCPDVFSLRVHPPAGG
ncbi:MAG: PIG-L deacetylase family protein [Angustibacter sp.]